MYSHHENSDFVQDTFPLADDQETKKLKFQEIGATVAGIYLAAKRQAKSGILAFKNGIKQTISTEANNEIVIALKMQKEQLTKRYLIRVVIVGVTSFVLGNICMFVIS